ncbi:methyltransferase domain-containing protein [candidate division KSB1 bacterium]|nr:methyltransferase domain-containing protein [candidate division KSB1 bacterium]RQW06149.1 MAG: methyltransferase domain-containing protein [candidate division KSB1 bacterium]
MKSIKINEALWQNYERFGRARGRLVTYILSHWMPLAGSAILDFGCGTGGISVELSSAYASVTAFDLDERKLEILQKKISKKEHQIKIVNTLPDSLQKFDAIILLDVIEHLLDPVNTLNDLYKRLNPDGIIYLSTPNKFSLVNAIMDPHFSLPLVSLLPRRSVKKIVAFVLKWQPKNRQDFPELFSLKKFDILMRQTGFTWHFVNSFVVRYALQHPEGVWNRDLHLHIIRAMQKIGALSLVGKLTSDRINFYNCWLNPTWYIIAKKARFCN